MTSVSTTIRDLGLLAATHELLAAGHHPRLLTHLVRTGEIIRVRQGWYCLPTVDPAAQQAVRVGGRLTCISGCAAHGLWVRTTVALHVAVEPDSVRLRSRTDRRVRLRANKSPSTVVHWTDTDPGGSRWRQSVQECLKCMALCRPLEETVAAADSALRRGKLTLAQWLEIVQPLPVRARALLAGVDARSESITESITRFRLQRLGIEPRLQVSIRGVGRVDFVIGERLVIEVDGWEYHGDREAFEADRSRDAKLSARGYRVLRFSYRQVMERWSEVRESILAAMSRGDHLS